MFLPRILTILICFYATCFANNNIDKSINLIEKTNTTLDTYQKKIDKIDDQTNVLVSKYKYVNQEIKNTKAYNKQLQEVITSQNKEIKEINQQLIEIEETQKNIFPLMNNMIKSLDK